MFTDVIKWEVESLSIETDHTFNLLVFLSAGLRCEKLLKWSAAIISLSAAACLKHSARKSESHTRSSRMKLISVVICDPVSTCVVPEQWEAAQVRPQDRKLQQVAHCLVIKFKAFGAVGACESSQELFLDWVKKFEGHRVETFVLLSRQHTQTPLSSSFWMFFWTFPASLQINCL